MTSVKVSIKAALKANKLSQTLLAKKLRCSVPFLNQVISGVRTSRRIQGGIAAFIGKPLADIWPDNKPSDKDAA